MHGADLGTQLMFAFCVMVFFYNIVCIGWNMLSLYCQALVVAGIGSGGYAESLSWHLWLATFGLGGAIYLWFSVQ